MTSKVFRKRILTWLLVLTLMVASLSACGKKNNNSEGGGSGTNVEKEPEEPGSDSNSGDKLGKKYNTISLANKNCTITTSNGYIASIVIDSDDGYYKFDCRNVVVTDDNKIRINKGGYICCLSPIALVEKIAFTGLETDGDIHIWSQDRYEAEGNTIDDLWFNEKPITVSKDLSDPIEISDKMLYFKIDGDADITFSELGFITPVDYEKWDEADTGKETFYSLENAKDINKSGDKLIDFTCTDEFGNDIKYVCKNVTVDASNNIIIGENGSITSVVPTNPIISCSFKDVVELDEDAWMSYKAGFAPVKENPAGEADILWPQSGVIRAHDGNSTFVVDGGAGYFNIKSEGGSFSLKGFTLGCKEEAKKEGKTFKEVTFDPGFYGYYTEGDYYDKGREGFSSDKGIFNFYLLMYPNDISVSEINRTIVYGTENFKVLGLNDKSGKAKDINKDALALGDNITVKIGLEEYKVDLPVIPRITASNLKELNKYANYNSTGDLNCLVVPVYFEETGYKESDLDLLNKVLGNVSDDKGNVTSYEIGNGRPSLSEYFNQSSYGKLNVISHVTKPYELSGAYADYRDSSLQDSDIEEIEEWLKKNYKDYSKTCDTDSDGYYDSAVFYIIGDGQSYDSYFPLTNAGAFNTKQYYDTYGVRDGLTTVNTYVSIGSERVVNENGLEDANVLIHEFSHGLGLVDYYDVSYSGINAVGDYDMQSANKGDWNPYSKTAAGWTNATKVSLDEVDKNGSVDVTIQSFVKTGDCIMVPTTANSDGNISAFDEYIMIDLYTPDGLNNYDAKDYDMEGAKGVRMYHVHSTMGAVEFTNPVTGGKYTAATILKGNNYNEAGTYLIEVLSKSGKNEFTADPVNNSNRSYTAKDLFQAGDSFSMASHSSFFTNKQMDNHTDFPYKISVKSIDGDSAVITISK